MGSLLVFAGFLLVLGIGGSIWKLIGRAKPIKQHFDTIFNSLPMGRAEVNDLSRRYR